ncbi:hypothetical protein [Thioalkalivibrio sp. ALE19]|uniref:hypothetical protein n=1 Tax=Thioalkalivibrio sp. ALE19 TaxID=1266909 RepID=UPI0012DEA446|nr:hypothetical protein [Thioalkalivibrio sp. ALE19]
MILTKDNFYETLDSFRVLPDRVTSVDEEEFRRVYGSDAAGVEKGIVYVLRTEKSIPRLKGKSDVVYIGQTKGTFRQRYLRWAKLHATSKANHLKFSQIVEQYGPIRIAVSPFGSFGDSLLQAEGQLLWWYFQNHCEYPPVNYTKTKVRNDSVSVDSIGA